MSNHAQTTKNQRVFPEEFIKNTIEYYTFKINSRSKLIYLITLFSTLCFLSFTPFIHLNISINSSGVITSSDERLSLYSSVSGRVVKSKLKENLEVSIGDTLIWLDYSIVHQKETHARKLLLQLQDFNKDLHALLSISSDSEPGLLSHRYQSELFEYQSNMDKHKSTFAGAKRNYERQKELHDQMVISDREFEIDEIKYIQAQKDLEIFEEQKKKQWQQEIVNILKEIDELKSTINQLREEKDKYVVISPSFGTLQNIQQTQPGQYIQAGYKISDISPTSELIASCWVSPSKIGMLRMGQKTQFRIDAFNFYDWGILSGEVIDISNDVYVLENNSTFFLVKCKLSKDHLSLKNGFKGYFKKGMTLQANFLVARRSIYQLIYDKVDNWLNPTRQNMAI